MSFCINALKYIVDSMKTINLKILNENPGGIFVITADRWVNLHAMYQTRLFMIAPPPMAGGIDKKFFNQKNLNTFNGRQYCTFDILKYVESPEEFLAEIINLSKNKFKSFNPMYKYVTIDESGKAYYHLTMPKYCNGRWESDHRMFHSRIETSFIRGLDHYVFSANERGDVTHYTTFKRDVVQYEEWGMGDEFYPKLDGAHQIAVKIEFPTEKPVIVDIKSQIALRNSTLAANQAEISNLKIQIKGIEGLILTLMQSNESICEELNVLDKAAKIMGVA